jgi:hypothetical protein
VRPGDDSGSLVFALLLTLVGVSVSALLMPVVIRQLSSTRDSVQRVHELGAAQAGIDVALAHIRAANDGAGNGVLGDLPCGPYTGTVTAGGTERYQVTIDYFATDPAGKSASWLAANEITCLTGGGTYSVPGYALLRSTGTDQATGAFGTVSSRTLQGTYTFQTTNQNIAGGLVHVSKTATSTDLCLDAGSGSPAAGTNVRMQPCSSGSSKQTFAYLSNLNLVLVSSKTTAMPLGMCLDAGSPHAVGSAVKLQQCASTTQPKQQWSYNDSTNFEGTSDGSTLDGYCIDVQSPNTAGSFVVLGSIASGGCRSGGYDNIQTWSPDAAVGAGAAGASSGQLVNFSEFGRCLDVTEQTVSYAYLIAWPCKQAPNAANVLWNQKWALPTIAATASSGTGRITTNPSGGLYCLQSPGTTAAGSYVKLAACPVGSTPANLTWTVYTDTGSYPTSYRIVDSYGYCLAPTDPSAASPDFYANGHSISKSIVTTCSGSTLQKWNAPPNLLQSLPLKDIGEN